MDMYYEPALDMAFEYQWDEGREMVTMVARRDFASPGYRVTAPAADKAQAAEQIKGFRQMYADLAAA